MEHEDVTILGPTRLHFLFMSLLVRGGKPEKLPEFESNLAAPFQGNVSALPNELAGIHQPHSRAVAERFPVETVLGV